jgi:hypothetical protein
MIVKKLLYLLLLAMMSPSVMSESIESINDKTQVELIGFECAEKITAKIENLGFGRNYRAFVTKDIEETLYSQQQDSQLVSLECTREPEYVTVKLSSRNDDTMDDSEGLSVTFFLKAEVKLSGTTWLLNIDQEYFAQDSGIPGKPNVTKTFNVSGSKQR